MIYQLLCEMKPLNVITIVLAATFLVSCAKSPTGRNQLKLYSNSQLANMGVQAFDGMKAQQKVSAKKVENQFVTCVTDHIIKNVPKRVFNGEWEVVVFEDKQVNAFALPGGKIGVYTGLLDVAENQHQLAAVIGHEVGHVIAEHGNERMSNTALIGMGMEVTNQLLKNNEIASSNTIMAAIGLGVQVGVQLPFSRAHESESDLIGLSLMAKAGFDPQGSVDLWKNMEKASGGKRQPEFMSTHPSPQSRIDLLENNMADAQQIASQAPDKPNCRKSSG